MKPLVLLMPSLVLCFSAASSLAVDAQTVQLKRNESFSQSADAPVASSRRIALVIGNESYKDAPLANPVNDAKAITQALRDSGFTVMLYKNADMKDMLAGIREFGDQLRKGGVGVFYYAGHGMQIGGRNYLIPVGHTIEREDEVAYAAVDAQAVLDKMEVAGNGANIMILDACRNNPFVRSFRSAQQGLAQMNAPVGTLVAFATAPGAVASDGANRRNGLYTQHLLTAMEEPGVKVEDVFKRVRTAVRRDSRGRQVPWEATSLEGDFYFKPQARDSVATASEKPSINPVPVSFASAELPKKLAATGENTGGFHVGDRWSFQVIDKYKSEIVERYSRTVTEILPDGDVLMGSIRLSPEGNMRSYSNHQFKLRTFHGPNIVVPKTMQIGHTEEFYFTDVANRLDGSTFHQKWKGTLTVKAKERIKVPAGEFDVYRIEREAAVDGTQAGDNPMQGIFVNTMMASRNGAQTNSNAAWFSRNNITIWYAPQIHHWVAWEETHRSGRYAPDWTRTELTGYELKKTDAADATGIATAR